MLPAQGVPILNEPPPTVQPDWQVLLVAVMIGVPGVGFTVTSTVNGVPVHPSSFGVTV